MTDDILKLSASLDRYELPADLPKSEFSCHVNIVPDIATGDVDELASTASICLVFDCSISMMGNKFNAAIKTAKMIVDILHERHTISLIAFHDSSDVVFKNAVPTKGEKRSIKKQIDKLSTYLGGTTNMAAGIKHGMKVLSEGGSDANIMVILSDGRPNSTAKAQKEANIAGANGVQLFAVGIGESYNAKQLLGLVTPSNGAVFGDSEESKIDEIFCDIINRIDRIVATNVKLSFAFDEHIQFKRAFKISPERTMYDSSTLNSDGGNVELRLGNIGDNRIYEILLKLEADRADVGTVALIRARLQYDTYFLGEKSTQEKEAVLTIKYTHTDTPAPDAGKKIKNAIKSATIAQLSDDLMQACFRKDNDRILKTIDMLQQHCDKENNEALQQQLDNIKNKILSGRTITDKDRNDFLLASTAAAPKAELFDLILVEPGLETIRLVREIRYATNKGLREIAGMMQRKNSVLAVFKSRSAAEKLQQRLVNIGAKVKINTREVEEDELDTKTY
jgi:ribosomal protein L7/L12/uncharacterized protein YegL